MECPHDVLRVPARALGHGVALLAWRALTGAPSQQSGKARRTMGDDLRLARAILPQKTAIQLGLGNVDSQIVHS
jgi:hypothetical protein